MEPKTGFTQDEIAAIVGTKELELIAMRMQLSRATERIAELEKTAPALKAVS